MTVDDDLRPPDRTWAVHGVLCGLVVVAYVAFACSEWPAEHEDTGDQAGGLAVMGEAVAIDALIGLGAIVVIYLGVITLAVALTRRVWLTHAIGAAVVAAVIAAISRG